MKISKYKNNLFVIFFLLVLAFYISNNWFQLAIVIGNSMTPQYHNMQLVLLDKHLENLKIGDVVAFKCKTLDRILIKRIVAGPGDRIQIIDKSIYVNGIPDEVYEEEDISYSGIAINPIEMNDEEYFVIGDNFEFSKDSRYEYIGCVKQEDIIGKVVY